MMVKFKKDMETNSYQWIYTGGCFEDGKAVQYQEAAIGEVQNFKNIQFEVRLDTRQDAGMYSAENEQEDDDDEEDDEYNPDKKVTETPEKKILREKKKLDAAVANGEIKENNSYFFYHLFKLFSLVCMLGAIFCLFYLIYELYNMFRGGYAYQQLDPVQSGRPSSRAIGNLGN